MGVWSRQIGKAQDTAMIVGESASGNGLLDGGVAAAEVGRRSLDVADDMEAVGPRASVGAGNRRVKMIGSLGPIGNGASDKDGIFEITVRQDVRAAVVL